SHPESTTRCIGRTGGAAAAETLAAECGSRRGPESVRRGRRRFSRGGTASGGGLRPAGGTSYTSPASYPDPKTQGLVKPVPPGSLETGRNVRTGEAAGKTARGNVRGAWR